ncbi:MAG: protein kinase [Deltaproteobacteria bacterium]|nr:protein kinase [Deltaproteobacteria bacterium]
MSIADVLAEIAAAPPSQWRALVDERIADPMLRAQAMLWLGAQGAPQVSERYVLGAKLDAGATAAVWQAFDKKLGRHVAIKVFHAEAEGALAEARAACDVISDHVVRVLDVHDGYIVMELVGEHQGDELVPGASAARARPRDLAEAVTWVRDVALGVHDAHLREVFHRDLKPHNVLITPVSRRARIGDFGLANRGGGGTPEYIAPELARLGASDRVAVDVWGLGALAYDLIAARPPWASWEEAASGEPPALLDAPKRLRRVIEKAMAIDPAARYASASAMADDLTAFLARRPTRLDRSALLRTALWMRRNPQLSATAGAAAALAAIALVGYMSLRQLEARSHELADEVTQQEHTNSELEAHVAKSRAALAQTEADLAARGEALAAMQRALADEQKQYEAIIAARDKALHQADAATRQLVEQLTIAQSDRSAAELGRAMYEGFWTSARADASRAAKDRDQAQHERDLARTERDQLQHERDAARAERDQALTDVARLTREAAAARSRIDELTRLIAMPSPSTPAGSAAVPHAGSAGS